MTNVVGFINCRPTVFHIEPKFAMGEPKELSFKEIQNDPYSKDIKEYKF